MMGDNIRVHKAIPYTFSNPHLYDAAMAWKDASSLVRKNGDIIIQDVGRVIICNPITKTFTTVALPDRGGIYSNGMVRDDKGQVYFDYGRNIYVLSVSNTVSAWRPEK